MTIKIHWAVPAGVCILALGIAIGRWALPSSSADESAAKFRRYCSLVHTAFQIDASAFASDDRGRQTAALERFGHHVTYHSQEEARFCAKRALDLSALDRCAFKQDFACLAKLAQAAADATKP